MHHRPASLLLAIALLAAAGCCGYTHRFPLPPGADGVKTVALHLFANRTLYQDIEFQVTAALQREISAKTELKIAPRAAAGSLITGSVDNYERIVLREFKTDEVARYAIVLTLSYEFTRLPSSGKPAAVISSAEKVKCSAEYEVLSNETEASARAEAVRKAARKLVSHMFEKEDW